MTRFPLLSALLILATVPLFAAADREASRPSVMIPVAGTVAGANGTRFQTDLTITNQRSGSSTGPAVSWIDVYWLPRDVPGSGTPVMRLALAHHAVEFYEDFVTHTLNRSGVGAIILRAVNEDGTPDLAGRIDAFARIWTPVPGRSGTVSQSVHASTLYFPGLDDLQPIPGLIYGLRQDASFRSNYGLVNMGTKRLTFTVRFMTSGSTIPIPGETISEQVVVEPQSMTHRAVPAAAFGPLTISVTAHQETSIINPTAVLQPWAAYGSSVDNTAGDGWYSKAQASYPHNER
ncbi:MAG TPA: hypothetical protein VF883_17660 [Thermoanaerobaculia bacterium]|jgi:hypothetical protein